MNLDTMSIEDCANVLNVSVPYILELVSQEKLEPHSLEDMSFDRNTVYTFKEREDLARHKVLDELSAEAQSMGMYD